MGFLSLIGEASPSTYSTTLVVLAIASLLFFYRKLSGAGRSYDAVRSPVYV